jgi:tRNA threonylcarbamoyladenosine biosynthesis protein TsaB
MDEAGIRAERLDRLAVGVGPGGFTGLRIAIAYAKALAAAWRLPLVPISSFDLLEYGGSFERVLTVVVGRPGVISARYRYGAQIERASGRTAEVIDVLLPPSVRHPHASTPLDVVGGSKDVLDALAERGHLVRFFDPAVTPAAAAVALAASSRTPAESLHEVRADYGELPAAKAPKP